ncbi:hypothetical protein [Labrys wisconsinensis]|uniref:Lectin-like protein BA14k n=1 Tax=Labrys wisconsinensis TaxID=425677 RepID=A0ABU0JLI2_9HYPH|nr:hypothetical protein [Labrys wisconsinensis]MDQ0475143.1 hypothetical protein [Labrys wisconsinensis]
MSLRTLVLSACAAAAVSAAAASGAAAGGLANPLSRDGLDLGVTAQPAGYYSNCYWRRVRYYDPYTYRYYYRKKRVCY